MSVKAQEAFRFELLLNSCVCPNALSLSGLARRVN